MLRLGEVCSKVGSGATPRGGRDVYLAHGVALIRSQNVHNDGFRSDGLAFISDEHARQLSNVEVHAEDVLLNITGDSVARCCLAPNDILPARVNQHVAIIRPDANRLDPRYLHYFLISPVKQAEMLVMAGGGGTRNALTKGMIEEFAIPAPEIAEQRAIADVLGSLDEKITQNRRTSRALERLARAIFHAWFVKFEPVKAKAAGAKEFPSMSQETFDALPSDLIESEFGPIPKDVTPSPLATVATLTMGQSPPSQFYNEIGEGLPFHQGVTDFGFRFPTHRVYCTAEGRLAEAGDILLSVRAPVGRINVADRQLVLGRGLAGLRQNNDQQSYLLYLLRHVFAEEDSMGEGTVYKGVNKAFLLDMDIVVPPAGIRTAFETTVAPLDELILRTEQATTVLAKMRQELLPRLLSGEVRVEVSHG